MRLPNKKFRCDLLRFIQEHGDVTPADVKHLAQKHGVTAEHIRVTFRRMKSENLIVMGAFLTEAGKVYLSEEGGQDV